jgi:DNA-binding response OmpR family regulator
MVDNDWTALVVEDDEDFSELVSHRLTIEGFDVTLVPDGRSALTHVERHGLPHIAVVDLMLPDMDGTEVCRHLRRNVQLPIIIISARDDEASVLKGMDYADHYLTKPFYPSHLAKLAKRLLSRVNDYSYANSLVVEVNERLALDYSNSHVIVEGETVPLTPIERVLLQTLFERRGHVVSSAALILHVWGSNEVYEDTLRVHIHRLRKKIKDNPKEPQLIVTTRGVGYSFAG